MAIYNLKMEPDKCRSAVLRYEYVLRINDFSWEKNQEKYNDFLYSENMNMPSFAKDPKNFWENLELFERANANQFRTIDFSLPSELSNEENIKLASDFAKKIFEDKYVYSLAVHSKPSSDEEKNNIHCHIMFSERELDGIERNEEQFFKRYNNKNPHLGGCRKSDEWTKYSKLYYIRQTWEHDLNEKLEEKNIEHVSCKSLKTQRQEALSEGNYLKAEMLDREPINLSKDYIDYAPETEEKKERIDFFEYCKEIKRIKEKEFKLKSENFEEENLKAKERYFKSLCEKEGMEYDPSSFDIQEKELAEKQKEELENLENIFAKSLDNHILIRKKENRLAQVQSITDEDIESRALNILTKGQYKENYEKLWKYNEEYNKLENKEEFKYSAQKIELENYFKELKDSEYFQNKLDKMKENIQEKYEIEKEEIFKDLEFLRKNKFKDYCIKITADNQERRRIILNKTLEEIGKLKVEKESIDKAVKEYKKEKLNVDHKEIIYREINPEMAEKYLEVSKWKEEIESLTSIDDKIELVLRIRASEKELNKFNLDNSIKEKLDERLKIVRNEYKELRQTQDDINGKLSYSFFMLKELKMLKEYNILEEEKVLLYNLKNLESTIENKEIVNKLEVLEYNTKLSLFNQKFEKAFKEKNNNLHKLNINLSVEDKKVLRKAVNERIENLTKEIEELKSKKEIVLDINNLTDDEIKKEILNDQTNGEYEKDLAVILYYDKRKEAGLLVSEINYTKVVDRIKALEKSFTITSEMIETKRQALREKNIQTVSKIKEKSNELKVQFKILQKLRITRLRKPKHNSNFYSPKLKVAKTGRIEFDDEKEKRRRGKEWEM